MKTLQLLIAVVMLGFASIAAAIPITFIHTGSGSGSLGGYAFGTSDFTITAVGDTGGKTNVGPNIDFIDHLSASITIDGLGTYNFITGTRTFLNNQLVGFSRAGSGGLDLFNGPSNAALLGWDMTSSIGPVAGTASLLQWLNSAVNTDGGQLIFAGGQSDATFQAIVGDVPEPSILLLMSIGLIGIGYRCRKS